MLNSVKEELEEYRKGYDSGEMMSIIESQEGVFLCDKALKYLDKLQKINIPEETKIIVLKRYIKGLDADYIRYKYPILDLIKAIDRLSSIKNENTNGTIKR